MPEASAAIVIDASTVVDLLVDSAVAPAVARRIHGTALTAPAHLDIEVLSALGRLERAGELDEQSVGECLAKFSRVPIERQPIAPLIDGAWARRHDTRLADALYVELAHSMQTVVVTTDRRLARSNEALTEVPGDDQ